MKRLVHRVAAVAAALLLAPSAWAAGTLKPIGSTDAAIHILDHHVDVQLLDGFARTEVTQTFFNPNPRDLEAIYAFPVPKSASLSEMTIFVGEREIHGEVIEREKAEQVYRDERDQGNDAGLARKNSYQTFEFRVSPVRANAETRVRFVYYQPIELDTGVGRYVYPLEDGGTDEIAKNFWEPNEKVERSFSMNLELRTTWPVDAVRMPGFEAAAQIEQKGEGHYTARINQPGGTLAQDLVLYYRLADGLPGRVEVLAYRDDRNEPGTFMAVVTPGIDLQPIQRGADYVFVLDTSGSMAGGKLGTLARGIEKALGEMSADDRFRVVTFSTQASELTRGWQPATPENVKRLIESVAALQANGSTNLYEGLALGFDDLDDDRATSVILVTDGVTNTGVIDPKEFHALLKAYDVRVFGFLMGNSANWPLMRAIANASGGFYAGVSNADDVLGQIQLAKSKVTHEALHDAELRIRGVRTEDVTGELVGKVYRGQQLVLFGRYEEGGKGRITLQVKLTGQDQTYETVFDFPEIDESYPEIERLWAMSLIEELEDRANAGLLDPQESDDAVRDLGVAYQLVTDQTAMIVLDDAAFDRHGIQRINQERVARERAAQQQRVAQPVQSRRVDRKRPMFDGKAPRGGGGAIDPVTGLLVLGLAGAACRPRRKGDA